MDNDSKDEEDEQGKEDDMTNKSSKGPKDETKSPMKPPAKPEPKKCNKINCDEGMEGTANDEDSIPFKVEANHKECKPQGRQIKRAGADNSRPIQPVQGQEPQGTSVPSACKNIRSFLLLPTGPWSPGCLFPWA